MEILEPLQNDVYPDQTTIMRAYEAWRQTMESFHDLTKQPQSAYLIGGLETASQEFLSQVCVRGGMTDSQPLQDAWAALLKALRKESVAGDMKLPWQTWFKEPD